MSDSLKKIFLSKWFRLVFSIVLVYVAFARIDTRELANGLLNVPWWFVIVMVIYGSFAMIIGSVRWSFLLLDKPKLKDFVLFVKANYIGVFYSLFLSSSVGGDLLKWLPLIKRYPQLTKAKIASSVLIDRIVGLSALVIIAFVAIVIGGFIGFNFPDLLFWLFLGLFLGMVVFYIMIYSLDFEKILGKYAFLRRLLQVVDVLKKENKRRLLIGLIISLLGQPIWISTTWIISSILGVGMSFLSVFIFMPTINLILTLPISVAGFGARENLFVYFFLQTGISSEKILLVSMYSGIIWVLNAVLGGLMILFSNLKSEEK